MKKIMILGGDNKSIPVIKAAKERNYYVVLCDYNDKLESINLVDKFYCVSVFDKDKLCEIAQEEKVNGVISYSSDKIALIANEVASKLELTKNPDESIEILIKKDKFRKFLETNNFNVPKSISFEILTPEIINSIKKMTFPLMVKPIDSAGSTGVTKINEIDELESACNIALENSVIKKIIVEEFIEMNHECMIAGDAFVYNGVVEFFGLLNSHRGLKDHPFIPTGTSYPFFITEKMDEIKKTIQDVISKLNIINCPLNLELMYSKNGKLYIIEIAPRNGGNLIPNVIQDTYGINMFDVLVSSTVGDVPNFIPQPNYKFATTYVLRSAKEGVFDYISYDELLKKHIYREVLYKSKGDKVLSFDRANRSIGILFLHFDSLEEELEIIHNIEKYIKIVIK